jgi:hypothetical protein
MSLIPNLRKRNLRSDPPLRIADLAGFVSDYGKIIIKLRE